MFINQLVTMLEVNGGHGTFISTEIPSVYALLFADNISMIADTTLQLQKKIDVLEEFCDKTGMKINLDKIKIVVFEMAVHRETMKSDILKGKKLK